MKSLRQKLSSTLLATAVLVAAAIGMASPQASATPNEVEIRLVTPVLTDANSWNGNSLATEWVGNGWFGSGMTFRRTYAPVNSSIVLTYYVTDWATHAPLVGQSVTLRVNKGWSNSNAIVKVGTSLATSGVGKGALDQRRVMATTDQFGFVTFVLHELTQDIDETAGEPKPAHWNDLPPELASDGDPSISLYSQLLPEVTGEKTDHADLTEFHFYKDPSPTAPDLTAATARIAAPALAAASAVHRTDLETLFSVDHDWYRAGIGVWQKYAKTSTTFNLVYTVADANGAWVPGKVVTVSAGKAFSTSTAHVKVGTVATNLAAANDADQAQWTATTDPFGTVLYRVQNTDTQGEPVPVSLTTTPPIKDAGGIYSQLWPEVEGVAHAALAADMVEFHFFTPPPPTSITSKLVGRKLTVTVDHPYAKSVVIKVGTAKAKTYTVGSSATSKAISISLTKGSRKIVVTCNGKSYTKTYTVK